MKLFTYLFFSLILAAPVFAEGECQSIKAQIKAKKGSCKSLPKEQRQSCKAEIAGLKQQHQACKQNAKAQKKS